MNLIKNNNNGHVDAASPWRSVDETIQNLFDLDFFPATGAGLDTPYDGPFLSRPALAFEDHGDYYSLRIDMPGVERKNLKVDILQDQLIIKGSREAAAARVDGKEASMETFERSVTLPEDVDVERTKAELKDGVLKMRLPKKEEAKPKTINVEVK